MPETPTGRELRAEFLQETRNRLMGPRESGERLRERPDKRYLCGMLFPKGAKAMAAVADEAQDGNAEGADDEAELESPTDLLFQRLPASVGLTFAVASDESNLSIRVSAATYEREIPEEGGRQRRGLWARTAIKPEMVAVQLVDGIRPAQKVLGDLAELHVRTRLANGKRVVTVALVNRKVVDEESERIDPADVLYQVGLSCTPSRGIPAYPDPPRVGSDPEADELALQYRSRPTFAVGHGCAVKWEPPTAGRVASVEVDFVPAVEVAPVTTDISDLPAAAKAALPLQKLQSEKFDPIPGLTALVDGYAKWHRDLVAVDVPAQFATSKTAMLARIEKVAKRMRAGCMGRAPSSTCAFSSPGSTCAVPDPISITVADRASCSRRSTSGARSYADATIRPFPNSRPRQRSRAIFSCASTCSSTSRRPMSMQRSPKCVRGARKP